MKRPGTLRRLVGFVVGAALLLSLAAPARAQLDPMTLSLIMGGFQLITGAISAITIGVGTDTKHGHRAAVRHSLRDRGRGAPDLLAAPRRRLRGLARSAHRSQVRAGAGAWSGRLAGPEPGADSAQV